LSDLVYEWGPFENLHLTLVDVLANQVLLNAYRGPMDRITRIRVYCGDRFTGRRLQEIAAERAVVLEAAPSGGSVQAEITMSAHLGKAAALLG
jgi:DNA-binding FadR family transcriptional regulator